MKRYFEKVSKKEFKKYYDELYYNQVIMPVRKTELSAGYDFYLIEDVEIKAGEKKVIPTGIKAYFQPGEVLFIVIRSGIGFKTDLQLSNQIGVIDADYYNNIDNEGHILVSIKNTGATDVTFPKGSRLVQGIFTSYLTSDDTPENVRKGGIGSTKGEGK